MSVPFALAFHLNSIFSILCVILHFSMSKNREKKNDREKRDEKFAWKQMKTTNICTFTNYQMNGAHTHVHALNESNSIAVEKT